MKKCPRCRSSMLAGITPVEEGSRPVWRCLGCAREVFIDPVEEREERQLHEALMKELSLSGRRRA